MGIAFLIGRVIAGLYFLENAYSHLFKADQLTGYAQSKGVPAPKLAVIGSGVLLLAGGASLLTGIRLPLGCLLLIVFLVPVAFMMHAFWKETDPQRRAAERIGFMKDIALAALLLMIAGSIATSF